MKDTHIRSQPLSACLAVEIPGNFPSASDPSALRAPTAQIFQLPLPFETTELLRRRPRGRPVCPSAVLAVQPTLPLAMPERVPTGLQVEILRLMVRLGAARSAVPSNPNIGTMIGTRCRQSVSKALIALEAMGILRVQYREAQRRFYIPRVALITGWGDHRVGFSRRRKALVFQVKAAPAVVTPVERMPMGRGAWSFMGINAAQWKLLDSLSEKGQPIGPASTCQWIGEDASFCGKRTERKCSYCDVHANRVYLRYGT